MGLMKETFSALVGDSGDSAAAGEKANLSSRLLSSTKEAAGIVRSSENETFSKKESLIIGTAAAFQMDREMSHCNEKILHLYEVDSA